MSDHTRIPWERLTFFVVLFVSSAALFILLNNVNLIRNQQDELARTQDAIQKQTSVILANQQLIKAQTCLIQKQTVIMLTGSQSLFDAFARHFGVNIRFPDLPGVPSDLQCKPAGGDDVFLGTNGSNRLRGTSGVDFMAGYSGNDRIHGRQGGDTIFGGKGNDHIWGEAGVDTLHGDGGNDVINARLNDHSKDFLDGGTGFDTCYVNNSDKTTSCEVVHRV